MICQVIQNDKLHFLATELFKPNLPKKIRNFVRLVSFMRAINVLKICTVEFEDLTDCSFFFVTNLVDITD